jgi:UDP-N-acetylmuramate--alanine ligase
MKNKHIHFIGVGGIGLSSLARYFVSNGFSVSGSDVVPQEDLKETGVKVYLGHQKSNISKKPDLVIYSNAVLSTNPEMVEAKKQKIKTQSYPEALGYITKKYFTVAVSGTHGKSTTTAMLALVMIQGGLDPTVIIGTKLKEFDNTNFRKGNSNYLLIEADEFKAALLNYYPKIAVITNIEEDHLDFYKNLQKIMETFQNYVKNNVKENILVLNKDDKNTREMEKYATGKVITYSIKEPKEEIKLSVFGKHNLSNAHAVFSVAEELKIKKEITLKALYDFQGTWRRFEEKEVFFKNKKKGKIIQDYAHHPTEIKATLEAINAKYPEKEVVLVFQPHQYERTYHLFEKFKDVLSKVKVKELILMDIYTVKGRESEEILKSVSTKMLSEKVKKSKYLGGIEETAVYLNDNLQENQIVVIMGAGDIYKLEGYITKRS